MRWTSALIYPDYDVGINTTMLIALTASGYGGNVQLVFVFSLSLDIVFFSSPSLGLGQLGRRGISLAVFLAPHQHRHCERFSRFKEQP